MVNIVFDRVWDHFRKACYSPTSGESRRKVEGRQCVLVTTWYRSEERINGVCLLAGIYGVGRRRLPKVDD